MTSQYVPSIDLSHAPRGPAGDGKLTPSLPSAFCRTSYYIKIDSPYSITERRVPELIPVLGSQPAGDASHKPGGRLPILSARPAVTPATLKRAATSFAVW